MSEEKSGVSEFEGMLKCKCPNCGYVWVDDIPIKMW